MFSGMTPQEIRDALQAIRDQIEIETDAEVKARLQDMIEVGLRSQRKENLLTALGIVQNTQAPVADRRRAARRLGQHLLQVLR